MNSPFSLFLILLVGGVGVMGCLAASHTTLSMRLRFGVLGIRVYSGAGGSEDAFADGDVLQSIALYEKGEIF